MKSEKLARQINKMFDKAPQFLKIYVQIRSPRRFFRFEQSITADLKSALEKRGCTITHRGSENRHAPGGGGDIIVSHRDFVLTVEATKARNTAQDREMLAIKAHLETAKEQNPRKDCFCIYTASATPPRMRDAIRDYNRQQAADGKNDLKILPLCFETLQLLLTRWTESEAALYPLSTFINRTYAERGVRLVLCP